MRRKMCGIFFVSHPLFFFVSLFVYLVFFFLFMNSLSYFSPPPTSRSLPLLSLSLFFFIYFSFFFLSFLFLQREDLDLTKRVWMPHKEEGFRLMAVEGRNGGNLSLRDEVNGDVRSNIFFFSFLFIT